MIFERKESRSTLDWVVKMVGRLRPGERIDISHSVLERIDCDRPFTPPDRVLENITGSSYEFRYRGDFSSRDITFERLRFPLDDGRRSYVSPDRRQHYNDYTSFGGLYEPKSRNAQSSSTK